MRGDFGVKSLDETTGSDFARLVEKHSGVWGGCWCMAFHSEGVGGTRPWVRIDPRSNAESGKVEPMPQFLHTGRVSMFEPEGFRRTRRLEKNHWVVTRVVRRSSRR